MAAKENELFSIDSKFAWTNRIITIRQCVPSSNTQKDTKMAEKLREKFNSQQLAKTLIEISQDDSHTFKINYLTKDQVKFFLLQEIIK